MVIRKKGFTLMELMMVVIIISMLAAFGIPSYQRMINKADERNAVMNLATIRGALDVYLARRGNTGFNGTWNSLNAVNTNLEINVRDSKMSNYGCFGEEEGNPLEWYWCWATHPDGWIIAFDGPPSGDIYCNAFPPIPCPACELAGNGGCGY